MSARTIPMPGPPSSTTVSSTTKQWNIFTRLGKAWNCNVNVMLRNENFVM